MNKIQIRNKILRIRKKNLYKNLKINFTTLIKVLKKNKIRGNFIGGYYPFNYELDITEIFKKLEKKNFHILLPKIKKKNQMDFFAWSTTSPLVINKYGIPEPTSNRIKYPSFILVPLVAFDKHYNRIGYGGGFYDRYIKKVRKIKKVFTIGIAYSFQKVKKIPINKYDIKLDLVITEKQK